MNEIVTSDKFKFKLDKQSLARLNEEPKVVWTSEGKYGLNLPFETQEEFEESVRCLIRQMDYSCFITQSFKEHDNEKKFFEYIPVDIDLSVHMKTTELVRDKNTVFILFKMGMRYLNEKPSQV